MLNFIMNTIIKIISEHTFKLLHPGKTMCGDHVWMFTKGRYTYFFSTASRYVLLYYLYYYE